jgi:glycosyltransferase involved in cell wall biosynthesis
MVRMQGGLLIVGKPAREQHFLVGTAVDVGSLVRLSRAVTPGAATACGAEPPQAQSAASQRTSSVRNENRGPVMLKIAQIAPLYESVPPRLYGGTERVVSYLTEELVRRGHEVTLYASGDSLTSAALRATCPRALRLSSGRLSDPIAQHYFLVELVAREARRFDVLHFHLDYFPFSMIRRERLPALTTMHGRLDIPDLYPVFREFREMRLVSISKSQRQPMQWANWIGTIHHGLPEELYQAGQGRGGYLAFVGRISPEKGLDRAVEIAARAGMKLKVAAKVDRSDQEYFDTTIRPLLRRESVEYIGEIGEAEKQELMGNAAGLLFPINWPEPFGLVMIEALACGTPVIAFRNGSVPEIVEDGAAGFVVKTIEEAVRAVERLGGIDRNRCRRTFEDRFSARRMCEQYLHVYQQTARIRMENELQIPMSTSAEGSILPLQRTFRRGDVNG